MTILALARPRLSLSRAARGGRGVQPPAERTGSRVTRTTCQWRAARDAAGAVPGASPPRRACAVQRSCRRPAAARTGVQLSTTGIRVRVRRVARPGPGPGRLPACSPRLEPMPLGLGPPVRARTARCPAAAEVPRRAELPADFDRDLGPGQIRQNISMSEVDEREVLRGWTDDWSIRGWILVMGGFQCAMLPVQISPRFVEFLKTAEASLS